MDLKTDTIRLLRMEVFLVWSENLLLLTELTINGSKIELLSYVNYELRDVFSFHIDFPCLLQFTLVDSKVPRARRTDRLQVRFYVLLWKFGYTSRV